jgi:hypothetical protein
LIAPLRCKIKPHCIDAVRGMPLPKDLAVFEGEKATSMGSRLRGNDG